MGSFADKLVKKFEKSNVVRLSDKSNLDPSATWTHTGSPELDFNLGVLGYPKGLITLSGKSKSGKTTLGLTGVKNHQRAFGEDGVRIILSSESRENKEYAENLGLDAEDVIVLKSKFVEDLFMKLQEVLDYIYDLWHKEGRAGQPKIIILWDSVGATVSRAEVDSFRENIEIMKKNAEKGTDTKHKHVKMAAFAGAATAAMKNMLAQIYNNDICFLAINHLKSNLNSPGSYTPGGDWLEYLPCLALRPGLKEWVKVGEEQVGQITDVKVHKNDFGSRKSTEIEICLGYGIVLSESDIAFAVEAGIVKKEGARKHSFLKGKLTWSTKKEFYGLYQGRNKLLNVLHTKVAKERHNALLTLRGVEE